MSKLPWVGKASSDKTASEGAASVGAASTPLTRRKFIVRTAVAAGAVSWSNLTLINRARAADTLRSIMGEQFSLSVEVTQVAGSEVAALYYASARLIRLLQLMERAARLSGAAKALYARQRRNAWEDSSLETLLPGWQAGPDQAAIARAFAAGQAMDTEEAVAVALGEG